jgi:alpha-beta hydrolase superfamily lysophospholipase
MNRVAKGDAKGDVSGSANGGGAFDWNEIACFDRAELPSYDTIIARDATRLAFRRYDANSDNVVIALHGSSAEGSYFHPLATRLSARGRASVYVPDLRGHGASGGRRGDVDYIGQLEDDIVDFIVAISDVKPRAKVFLLGHSSGGGLVVRFAGGRRISVGERPTPGHMPIAGYILLAPFLGATVATTRPASGGWADVDAPAIVDLATRTARGDSTGQDQIVLRFNKSSAQRTGREVLGYSYRMMVSYHPRADLAADLAAIDAPLLLLAGARDEAFVAVRYAPIISPYAAGTFKVLPDTGHLGLVVSPKTTEEIEGWLSTLDGR